MLITATKKEYKRIYNATGTGKVGSDSYMFRDALIKVGYGAFYSD